MDISELTPRLPGLAQVLGTMLVADGVARAAELGADSIAVALYLTSGATGRRYRVQLSVAEAPASDEG